ncbi:MerR family transcriptional regulator [Paenibacillus cymbidii]|uniref:MerR family transcriptional regulator n=1 Tax=Paenibacillus cymbidii TaxID=1639034 RepID=UPI0014369AAA|nr:MerR family transcriptional regulator [Paenibacillus cymbidii]
MMTIQAFAHKTGLSPSALRFYESKRLLLPQARGDNGYRYYTEEQVPQARLIHTFRQAGVPVGEIRLFQQASPDEQEALMDRWRRETERKLRELLVAKQYWSGARPGVRAVNLAQWEDTTRMIWFLHEVEPSVHPYARAIAEDRRALVSGGCGAAAEAYVCLLRAEGKTLHAEIGFRLGGGGTAAQAASRLAAERPGRCRVDSVGPTLFATLETEADDPTLCIRYSRMLDRYGFQPIGPRWERYETGSESQVLSYIPVLSKEEA